MRLTILYGKKSYDCSLLLHLFFVMFNCVQSYDLREIIALILLDKIWCCISFGLWITS
jgi:hypothetical protein